MSPTTRNRAFSALGALALLLAGAAGADTFNVDRFDDSTANACNPLVLYDCGLRGAIIRANSNPGDDVVWLRTGTYTLSIPGAGENLCQTGDLDATDTVLIVGRGPDLTVVDAGGDGGVDDRVFDVLATGKRLTLRGLTVTGGDCPEGEDGGAIRGAGGSLRLEACAVSGNLAQDFGAAVISSTSTAPGDLTEIVDSWITGNTSHYSILHLGTAHIERTTVSGNILGYYAATVEIFGDGSVLVASTFEGSTGSTGDSSVLIWGTGAAIEGCTLVGDGGPPLGVATSGSATVSNTLLAGSCSLAGTLTSLGGNLESPGDTCGLGGSDLVNVADLGLSALGFFGGPAPVRRPEPGSPALDQPIAAPGCSATDQRALSRPRDGDGDGAAVCDIGAVELAGAGEIFVETFECGFTTPWSDVVR